MNRAQSRVLHALAYAILACILAGAGPVRAQWPAVTDMPTHAHAYGRAATVDLFTDDVAAAERFYAEVFGWTFERYGLGQRIYSLARASGQRVGGVAFVEKATAAGSSGRWIVMVSVPDVGAATKRAIQAGGKVLIDPRELPGRGTAAVVSDPEGAPFGLMHAAGGDPPDELGPRDTWLWGELWSREPAAMAAFYESLGVYSVRRLEDDNNPTEYHLVAGGYPRAGIVRIPHEHIPPVWLPYLRVDNLRHTLERVVRAGGRVVLSSNPNIRGGRIAIFVDPVGAPVGIAEWSD